MTVITLLTDFGTRDGYVGVMKGVILDIAPAVQIVDLSHEIAPQDILEAALLLRRVVPYFPDGTIHVAVIDPGVGTSRRGIAAQLGSQYFVGPDNGILSLIPAYDKKNKQESIVVNLDQPRYWLSAVYQTFHGRDVFAPVAAHLAYGVPLNELGTTIRDPIRLQIPQPSPTPNGWIGQVIHIDNFGNLSTNLDNDHIKGSQQLIVNIKGEQIIGSVSTFGDRSKGTLIALLDSSGSLAISVVNGSAAQLLNVRVGDQLEVLIK
jgi:S-adenosylmethionine hydrolase